MIRPTILTLTITAASVFAQTQGRVNTPVYSESLSPEPVKKKSAPAAVRVTRPKTSVKKDPKLLPPLRVLGQIEPGMERAKVLSLAGKPQGRVDTGSIDEESWTYASKEGDFVKVRLEKGVVKSVLMPDRP